MSLTQVSSNKCAGGFQKVFEHESTELRCKMKFAVYLPPKAETDKCPVLYWLSGLTCTEQNFITKAGSGCDIEGEDESWDFGTGAGFYVDATEDPWKKNYRMYSYITEETVSAFAPICNPAQSPWGQKAFSGYLGSDRDTWQAYDATVLAASYSGPPLDVLIDQGRDDQFLSANQLLPDNLIAVCSEKKIPVVFRLQPGYDHSYFFIYSFMSDHIKHHAKFLNA
ncbi:S-formylglutathione hydrolase [Dissostichus eleginoides]|uniref:S-formylglutathione hydrolase n=1 Tax=Dissostichus eleginoides TaxID=100907 RepID=A0AAD9FIM0_DISEL|nr:S-formylglutathione hydrolase [Dissostichus eleginoides]